MVTTAAAPFTLEEFSRLPRNGERHEISDGILITVPPAKSLRSRIARLIFKVLESWLEKSGRAEALIEAGYVLAAEPLTIRQPDISVLSLERIRTTLPDSYFAGAPELAVEIIFPSDTAEETDRGQVFFLLGTTIFPV